MQKLSRHVIGLLLSVTFFWGCQNTPNPVGVSANADGSNLTALSMSDSGTNTGIVTVIHGVPGLTVDVYVNGELTLPSFAPGTVTDPLQLPEGNYDIVIVAAGGNIESDDGKYLWATFTSPIFRFVDDFEARIDEQNAEIHLRSASRVGHGDMGVNKKRVDAIVGNYQASSQ